MFINKWLSANSDQSDESKASKAKVISFLNQKGGVGKTTLTFEVAQALCSRKKKVLCIDLDPQANLTYLLESRKEDLSFHIFHLLINSIRELKALHTPILPLEAISLNSRGPDLIASGSELSGFELTVAGINSPRQIILQKFLENSGIKERYDYILIDGPPTLGLIVVNIICASDGLLIPFHPDKFSKLGLIKFYETLQNIEEMGLGDGPKVLGHIPNLVASRRKQEEEDFNQIEKLMEEIGAEAPIFNPLGNKSVLARYSGKGKSIFSSHSKEVEALQNEFLKMADTIVGELP